MLVKNIVCEKKRQINKHIKASCLGPFGWEQNESLELALGPLSC